MDARDVVHACSNASVAQAAVFSIGGAFVTQFASEAHRRHLGCGPYAARLVRDFARTAGEAEWTRANSAARGVELPVLSCLRFILDHGLATSSSESARTERRSRTARGIPPVSFRPSCSDA